MNTRTFMSDNNTNIKVSISDKDNILVIIRLIMEKNNFNVFGYDTLLDAYWGKIIQPFYTITAHFKLIEHSHTNYTISIILVEPTSNNHIITYADKLIKGFKDKFKQNVYEVLNPLNLTNTPPVFKSQI